MLARIAHITVVEKLDVDIGRDTLRREEANHRRLTLTDGDTEIRRFEGDDRSLVVGIEESI